MSGEEKGMSWRHGGHGAFRVLRIVGMVVAGVMFAAAFALLFGWLVMLLWNWIMPAIFHLGVITYWQGFGILLLAKIIFGALGNRGPGKNPWGGNPFWKGPWHRGGWHEDGEWWRQYHDFWKDEGREAFERYREKRKTEAASEPDRA
jgi:hypothetical protein